MSLPEPFQRHCNLCNWQTTLDNDHVWGKSPRADLYITFTGIWTDSRLQTLPLLDASGHAVIMTEPLTCSALQWLRRRASGWCSPSRFAQTEWATAWSLARRDPATRCSGTDARLWSSSGVPPAHTSHSSELRSHWSSRGRDGDDYYTHITDLELSNGPLRQHRLRLHLDYQIAVVQRLLVERPVMVTLHLNKREKLKFTELTPKEPREQKNHAWWFAHTLPFSTHCVTITMLCTFCSQTIFQKSSLVPGKGPWVAMYSRLKLLPFKRNHGYVWSSVIGQNFMISGKLYF